MTIREEDAVVLTRTLPVPRLDAGTVGRVVHVYGTDGDPTGYEVAFDHPAAGVATQVCCTRDVRVPTREEIAALAPREAGGAQPH